MDWESVIKIMDYMGVSVGLMNIHHTDNNDMYSVSLYFCFKYKYLLIQKESYLAYLLVNAHKILTEDHQTINK